MALHHTFGDSCMLKEESNTFTRRASSVAIDPPKVTAQFFYCSPLPIDDPLAAIPAPSSSSATKSVKVPPRPFSVHDNLALEQAWLKIQKESELHSDHTDLDQAHLGKQAVRREDSSPELYPTSIPQNHSGDEADTNEFAQGIQERTPLGEQSTNDGSPRSQAIKSQSNTQAGSSGEVAGSQIEYGLGEKSRIAHMTLHDDLKQQPFQQTVPVTAEEIVHDERESGVPKARRSRSFFHRKEKEEKSTEDLTSPRSSARRLSRGKQEGDEDANTLGRSPDTTGTPFLRVPARLRRSRSRSPNHDSQKVQLDGAERDYRPKQSSPLGETPRFPRVSSSEGSQDENRPRGASAAHITVGISRLHVVEMPSLKVC